VGERERREIGERDERLQAATAAWLLAGSARVGFR
jgi:hypothetical protein